MTQNGRKPIAAYMRIGVSFGSAPISTGPAPRSRASRIGLFLSLSGPLLVLLAGAAAGALTGAWLPAAAATAGGIVLIALAVMLYCDRDVAPIFGHLSPLAGEPHR